MSGSRTAADDDLTIVGGVTLIILIVGLLGSVLL